MENQFETCQFCSCNVRSKDLVDHIHGHIFHDGISSDYCKLCHKVVGIESTEETIEHMLTHHKRDRRCPFCEKLVNNLDALFYHIKANTNIVYNCKYLKCYFVTSDRAKLKAHLSESKHKEKNVSREYIVNCSLGDKMMSIEEEEMKMFGALSYSKEKSVYDDVTLGEVTEGKRKRKQKQYHDDDYQSDDLFSPTVKRVKLTKRDSGKMKPAESTRTIKMDYSDIVLKKCCKHDASQSYDYIDTRLKNARSFSFGVSEVDGTKNYSCMSCKYSSPHSHADVRKHIINQHCGLARPQVRLVIRASKYNADLQLCSDHDMIIFINREKAAKGEPGVLSDSDDPAVINDNMVEIENKEPAPTDHTNVVRKSNSRCVTVDSDNIISTFFIDYSERVLRKCSAKINDSDREQLYEKLKDYKTYSIGIAEQCQSKYFVCMTCYQTSAHSHSDIRRHILSKHCRVPSKNIPIVIKSSRYVQEQKLMSDREMIKSINREKISKHDVDLLNDSEDEM